MTALNISNVLQQSAPLGLVAIGQTFVILAGGIDISVAAAMSLGTCVLMGVVNGSDGKIGYGIVLCVLFGLAIGLANGLIVVTARVPAFVVTFGTASIIQGITFLYTKQVDVGSAAPLMTKFAFRKWGFVSALALPMLLCGVVALVVQNRSVFGRWVYAVGGSEEIARLSGIRTNRIRVAAFVLSGLMAALASVALSFRAGSGDPLGGSGFDWDSIAAVVIGGTALTGGKGGVAGSVLGAVILTMLTDIMNLAAVSGYIQVILKGCIVLLAVVLSTLVVWKASGRLRNPLSRRAPEPLRTVVGAQL